MSQVTISSKYQVLIPRDVKERRALRSGQKVEAFAVDGRIELGPAIPVGEMKGALKGMPRDVEREPDRSP